MRKPIQSGFTLLELLVVITLLAVIAGVAIQGYGGVQDQGRADAVKFEMAELRKALLQFRRDSGSRDFPKQGVYDCTTIPTANFPSEAGVTNAEQIAWCQHPANFWMLFQDPLDEGWNTDTHRGWNGPYLQRKSGYLTLTSNTIGLSDINNPMWAIADPFIANHATQSSGVNWSIETASTILQSAGSPFLLLDSDLSTARIVSLGDNGDYDGDGTDLCSPPLDPISSEVLDYVVCLLR